MTEEGAIKRAEELRRTMAATPVKHHTSQITVTASFGVATFPIHGRTADELIAAADRALYSAKTDGRNRVNRCFGPQQTRPSPFRLADKIPPDPTNTVVKAPL
jgi:diguanylate cyclase (GGDEF)-like protein